MFLEYLIEHLEDEIYPLSGNGFTTREAIEENTKVLAFANKVRDFIREQRALGDFNSMTGLEASGW